MAHNAETYSEAQARLEEIVGEVRSKDVSLERSLDLFDEAIKIGNTCFELIDQVDYVEENTATGAAEALAHMDAAESEAAFAGSEGSGEQASPKDATDTTQGDPEGAEASAEAATEIAIDDAEREIEAEDAAREDAE